MWVGDAKLLSILLSRPFRIWSASVNLMKCLHLHFSRQSLSQVAAKRSRMIRIQTDVFVHVEATNPTPGKSFNPGQRVESVQLRSSCGEYNCYVAARFSQFYQCSTRSLRGRSTGSLAVGVNFYLEAFDMELLCLNIIHDESKLPSFVGGPARSRMACAAD